jgi:hypothetical protein
VRLPARGTPGVRRVTTPLDVFTEEDDDEEEEDEDDAQGAHVAAVTATADTLADPFDDMVRQRVLDDIAAEAPLASLRGFFNCADSARSLASHLGELASRTGRAKVRHVTFERENRTSTVNCVCTEIPVCMCVCACMHVCGWRTAAGLSAAAAACPVPPVACAWRWCIRVRFPGDQGRGQRRGRCRGASATAPGSLEGFACVHESLIMLLLLLLYVCVHVRVGCGEGAVRFAGAQVPDACDRVGVCDGTAPIDPSAAGVPRLCMPRPRSARLQ